LCYQAFLIGRATVGYEKLIDRSYLALANTSHSARKEDQLSRAGRSLLERETRDEVKMLCFWSLLCWVVSEFLWLV